MVARLDKVRWLGLFLVGGAALAWAAWHWADSFPEKTFLRAWMPNVGIDFAIIALTIFVVDRAQRQDEKHRTGPQVNWTLSEIGSALARFALAARYDYATTHLANYKSPPGPIVEALTHWENGLATIDVCRERDEVDVVIRAAILLKDAVN